MSTKWWKTSHEYTGKDDQTMEIELEYDHEIDLFNLRTKSWDYDPKDNDTFSEIILYPKDLPEISKLFSKALMECKNAGWWKKD